MGKKVCIKPIGYILLAIFILKLGIMALFSSDIQNKLFLPFISYFLGSLQNPWKYYLDIKSSFTFPYPPLTLYIESLFFLPAYLFAPDNIIIQNIFFKLPTFLSDILITCLLIKLFPQKLKEIVFFYATSPIIIYVAYMHSQIDLISVAVLFLSIYLLITRRPIISAIFFGLVVSIKFPALAALPLILIYIYKNYNKRSTLYFIFIPAIIYTGLSFPFILTDSYRQAVLNNNEQYQILTLFFQLGTMKVYIAPLALLLIYYKFATYYKVNRDLLFSFLGLLFSVFILLIPPMPNWYLWMMIFASVFFINANYRYKYMKYLYSLISIFYIVYFIFFYSSVSYYGVISDLNFLSEPINFTINNSMLRNLSFTLLEGTMLILVYLFYILGTQSNSIYKFRTTPLILGIGGDSSTGKSTFIDDIRMLLGENNVLTVEGDDDHKWEREDAKWGYMTHLNLKANDLHKQAENLISLKMRNSVMRSEYDHATGKFKAEHVINPKDYIIIGGLHPFCLPRARMAIDFKIYFDTDEKLRQHWKIIRDTNQRGYTKEQVVEQITSREKDAQKYVYPQKEFADVIVSYYTEGDFEVGQKDYNPELKLKITLNSNFSLDAMIDKITESDVIIYHDYETDLKNQYIIFEEPIPKDILIKLTHDFIQNTDEIVSDGTITWQEGYRGTVQFIILFVMSQIMRGDYTVEM